MLTRDYDTDVVDPLGVRPYGHGRGRRRKPGACAPDEQLLLANLPLLLDRHGAGPELQDADLPGPGPEPVGPWTPEPWPADYWTPEPEPPATELLERVPAACFDDDAPLYGHARPGTVALVPAPVTALADDDTRSIRRIEPGPRSWRERMVAAGLPAALRRGSNALTAAASRVHVDA